MKHETILIEEDPRADEAIARWDELKRDRAHFESDWEEMSRLIRPQRGGFVSADPGAARNEKALSSAPMIAQSNFASGLYGTMTNPANRWMSVAVSDPELAEFHSVKLWQNIVSDRILASFRPSISSFYSSAIQMFGDLSTFGNGAQYDEVRDGEGKILDVTLSLAEVVYDIDAFGRVVEVVRKFKITARAAVDMFGLDNLPKKVQDMAIKGSRDKLDFFHHVQKNMDWQKGRIGPGGKLWASLYVCAEGRAVVRNSGYDEMPFHAPRWEVDTGQIYGRGPGSTALPSARVVNRMEETNLRAAMKAADPTLLAPDREAMPIDGVVRPGEVLYGGVNFQGQKMIHSLDNYGGTGLTIEMADRKMEDIRDAFHWSLMNLAGRTGITDLEALDRQEANMRLMAPHMGRVQEEYLAPKIARRFNLLWRAGQLPPPPPELKEGVGLEARYESAAAQAQRSAEGASVIRLVNDLAPLAQIKPRLMDRLSADDLVETLHEARGVPSRVLLSREAADKIGEQRAQQEQNQQAMEMAQAGGGVMKDMAQAQAAGAVA